MLQFKLHAAHSAFQQARRRGLPRFFFLARGAIFGDENGGFQDSSRAGSPCRERGDGREESTSELYTSVEGKVIEIRKFLEWFGRNMRVNHQFECCGFGDRGFENRDCVLSLAAAGLESAAGLGSGFLGLAVFLVAVTLGCLGSSVTG